MPRVSDASGLRIPIESLAPETLHSVLEEIVTRDGTDATEAETKIEQVLAQLRSGRCELWFDEDTRTCTVRRAGADASG